ncbi:MAG: divergent polysaccharide deacetylase family protein [Pseudomonadota bacterium]
MGVFWQGGRRSRRSPARILDFLLKSQYGAAEAVLGAVAVTLVVWLLWPEERGPQLDQRAIWQQSVEEAERRRAVLEAQRSEGGVTASRHAESSGIAADDRPRDIASRQSPEQERRRIATPSELADRLDRLGRRPGDLSANQAIQPSPKRPARSIEPAIDAEPLLEKRTILAETAPGIDESQPPLDVAVVSSEALDAEPLPEVDLSDLDSLVPQEDEPALEATASLDAALSDSSAVELPTEPTIEPFIVQPDDTVPSTDVRERPLDDAPTWMKNAVTAFIADDRPIIAVVIDDLGLNRPNTAALNELPSPLTLAFLPYAGRIEAQTAAAQAAGHELMLHLPMEPLGSDWPGPDALTTKIDQDEFAARLQKNLDRFEGFVGINNHMGSRLTADGSRMDAVMRELRKRDVLFLDSKTSARSVAGDVAEQNGVPNTTRDVFLDHVINLDSVRRQLALTEKIAVRSGSAVAIGHPHGTTIEALREWLPTLEARGFALAPISAVVARRACSSGVLIAPETCGRYLQARSPSPPALAAKDG